ncbi:hypothetical protein [Paenibacillus sp. FSL H7-0331]|uniref:hypothetical protein n=1 Tax=Paenibacillus sp. FSL H7-0331 TaxID=1920421 RepID=UPI00096C225C|nr:hypothetical protein [Paenibacillus sp. FSL H7-0331]OME95717.1 hypothetical protein BK127_41215 [Paenibacillus sp. FSL H7-0331]
MSVFQINKENHLQLVYKNNVVIARDGNKLIVVHSKRSIKPLLPFEITKQVYEQWRKRDSRMDFTDTPYNELFTSSVIAQTELECVLDFNKIEFIEN